MEEIKKIDKYLLKIMTVENYKKKENKIEELTSSNRYLAKQNGVIAKEKDQMIEVKEKEIKRLQDEILKHQAEKLDLAAELSMKNMDIEELNKSINTKIANAKGGFTKEINKQKALVTAKEETIKSYTEALTKSDKRIKELEERNKNQEEQISKLLSEKKHITPEYINDGLPRQSKKALSSVIQKKQFEKGEALKATEVELEKTIQELDSAITNSNISGVTVTSDTTTVDSKEKTNTNQSAKQKKISKKKKKSKR